MKTHPLEIRPISGYTRRVHLGAFARAVETVMNFDQVDVHEATRRIMAELEADDLYLKVQDDFAAYIYRRVPK